MPTTVTATGTTSSSTTNTAYKVKPKLLEQYKQQILQYEEVVVRNEGKLANTVLTSAIATADAKVDIVQGYDGLNIGNHNSGKTVVLKLLLSLNSTHFSSSTNGKNSRYVHKHPESRSVDVLLLSGAVLSLLVCCTSSHVVVCAMHI